jgi:hypothetical protein
MILYVKKHQDKRSKQAICYQLAPSSDAAKGLPKAGVMDQVTLREFDRLCLPPLESAALVYFGCICPLVHRYLNHHFSDHFDMAIFLVRFPYAGMVEQAEEKGGDAFTFLENRAQGLNWIG